MVQTTPAAQPLMLVNTCVLVVSWLYQKLLKKRVTTMHTWTVKAKSIICPHEGRGIKTLTTATAGAALQAVKL